MPGIHNEQSRAARFFILHLIANQMRFMPLALEQRHLLNLWGNVENCLAVRAPAFPSFCQSAVQRRFSQYYMERRLPAPFRTNWQLRWLAEADIIGGPNACSGNATAINIAAENIVIKSKYIPAEIMVAQLRPQISSAGSIGQPGYKAVTAIKTGKETTALRVQPDKCAQGQCTQSFIP